MVEDAVFLLVVGHPSLTLFAHVSGVTILAQALVGLHAHTTITAAWLTLGHSTEGSFPAWTAAALACGRAVSILTVSGAGCHQKLRRLHSPMALFWSVRPFGVHQFVELPTVRLCHAFAAH